MKIDHFATISGLGSSWFKSRFRAWAYKIHARIPPRDGLVKWEVSADGNGEKRFIEAVLRDKREGRLGRVVMAGHSNGARDMLFAAQTFYAAKIPVEYAASLDMTLGEFGAKAFGNIKYLDEFWARLERVDFDKSFVKTANNYSYFRVNKSHVAMASEKSVQDRVVAKVTEALR